MDSLFPPDPAEFCTIHQQVLPCKHCQFLAGKFDGPDVTPTDDVRLTGQLAGVYEHLRYGGWFTLRDLAGAVGGSEAGVSARLRDLRKPKFGGHTVERRRRSGGLWQYHLREAPEK